MISRTGPAILTASAAGVALSLALLQTSAAATAPASAQEFVTKAAQGGLAEVELSKMAQTRAHAAAVKSFAARMVHDHTQANSALQAIAVRKGLSVPTDTDAEHRALIGTLSQETGEQFDKDYVAAMTKDHDAAIGLFEGESSTTGPDAERRAFAATTLPTLKMHRQMVTGLGDPATRSGSVRGE